MHLSPMDAQPGTRRHDYRGRLQRPKSDSEGNLSALLAVSSAKWPPIPAFAPRPLFFLLSGDRFLMAVENVSRPVFDGAACELTARAKSRSPVSLTLWAGSGCEATPSKSRRVLLRSLSASRNGNGSGKLAKP